MRYLFSLLKFVLLPLLIITTIIGEFQVGGAVITGLRLAPGTCGTSLVVTAAGGVVALNGLDNVQAGLRQAWTGKPTQTLTSSAVESATGSYLAGEIVDAGIGLISPGGVRKIADLFKKTCFTAGTQIVVGEIYDEELTTTVYATVNIEDIKVGDFVYSYDTITGEVSQNEVTDTFVRTSNHINYLTIVDENGNEQIIETTDSHPFWVITDNPDLDRAAKEIVSENGVTLYHENLEVTENGYWVEAKDLKIGDIFFGANGELSILVSTERVEFPEGITVYNFAVDGNHDYFVIAQTDELGQTCILVHNSVYDIQQGVHRTVVARDLGMTTIRANVNAIDGHIIAENVEIAIKDIFSPLAKFNIEKYFKIFKKMQETPENMPPIEVLAVTKSRLTPIQDVKVNL